MHCNLCTVLKHKTPNVEDKKQTEKDRKNKLQQEWYPNQLAYDQYSFQVVNWLPVTVPGADPLAALFT